MIKSIFYRIFFIAIFIINCSHAKGYYNSNTNFKKDNKFYVSLGAGYSLNQKSDSGKRISNFDATSKSDTEISDTMIFQMELGYILNPQLSIGIAASCMPKATIDFTENTLGESNGSINIEKFVGEIASYGLMSNLYFHPKIFKHRIISPYISGGIGMYVNHLSDFKRYTHSINNQGIGVVSFLFNNSNTSFAWQIGTGVQIKLTKTVAIDINYKYLDRGHAETKNSFIVIDTNDGSFPTNPASGALSEDNIRFKKLDSHQIMISTIINLW